MTSRTPIRLTPYRGPLATPSTSPESSPTLSTPPSDISGYSTDITGSTPDVATFQRRISTLSPPTRHRHGPRLYRRGHEEQGLFGPNPHLSPLSLVFKRLIYSATELARTFAGIVTFCLFIWGLLEWSSYASELPRPPTPSISFSRFPLPFPTRALRCHIDPSLCEARDQHVAVLQFLSEQIQHAKALSSLSTDLGLPFRAFLEAHRTTVPSVIVQRDPAKPPHVQEVDTLVNLTEFLDSPVLDFTSGGFIGRSFALALEEMGDLISEATILHGPSRHGEHQYGHLYAIYWRTASNLLLEYSAARPRARRLLHHIHALHRQLLPLTPGRHVLEHIVGRSNTWRWKDVVRRPVPSIEDEMQTLVTGLEVTLDNVHRLIAYLDWITEHLAQTTLRDVLKTRHRTRFSACMMSLQELFAQSKLSTSSKRFCFCLDNYGVLLPNIPERVEVRVPGSPTVRAER